MKRKNITIAIGVYDALTAKIAEAVGFECISIGGYSIGASLGVTEPLLSMSEFVSQTRYIANAVNIPTIADGDAGWGDPIHTMRTVKAFESSGAASIILEDQVYPKRMGYHVGETRVIREEEMVHKIRAAIDARDDEGFVLVIRTDAIKAVNGSFEEGLKRVKAYENAGADMIQAYPETKDQLKTICESLRIPFIFDSSLVTRAPIYGGGGNPPTPEELEKLGVKITEYSELPELVTFEAVSNALRDLKQRELITDASRMMRIREELERLIGINNYYKIEKQSRSNGP